MKRARTLPLVLALVLALVVCLVPADALAENLGTGERTFTFALLSDVHYVDPANIPAAGTSARSHFDYAEAAECRLMAESDAILSKALDGAIASQPDAILISGDLTSNGEYANAEAFVSRLREAKSRLSDGAGIYVVNGNHDLNMSYAASFADDGVHESQRMQQEDFRKLFAGLGYGEEEGFPYYADASKDAAATVEVRNSGGLSYATQIADGVTLIALDVAMYSNNADARFNQAQRTAGYVSEGLLSWAKEQAEAAHSKGDLVLAMAHHAMMPHVPMDQDAVKTYMAEVVVGNWEEVANTLADAGVTAFVTGHTHSNDIAAHVSPSGNTIYDINTAALCAYPCGWRTLKVTASGEGANTSYNLAIDTTFVEGLDGVEDLQSHAYAKTGFTEQNLEPVADNLLRLALHGIVTFDDAAYGTGLNGYLRQKLGLTEPEVTIGTFVTEQAKGMLQTVDVSSDIDVMSFYKGRLTAKFSKLEGSTASIDVHFAKTGGGEESATFVINLAALPSAIDGLVARVDQQISSADWNGNYAASSIQKDVNKLLAKVLIDATAAPLDADDPLSAPLRAFTEAFLAFNRGDEQSFVWKGLGLSSAEELAQKRASWRALIAGETFAQAAANAIYKGIVSTTSSTYPTIQNLLHETVVAPDGAKLVQVAGASQGSTFLPLVGGLAGSIQDVTSLISFLNLAGINPVSASMVQPLGQIAAGCMEALTTDSSIASDSSWQFHTVCFDANGGSVAPVSDLTVEGGKLGRSTREGAALPVPTREGYRFDGWFTEAEAGDPIDVDADYSAIPRIFAHWTFEGTYECKEGDRGSWTKGADQPLAFVFSRSVENETIADHFVGVRVDGTDVDPSNYTVDKQTMTVSLAPSYLQTLAGGDHTLTAVFNDADGVDVTFGVAAPKSLFVDVNDETSHHEDIYWLAETGISEGWQMADGTRQFRPYASIARADMAAFLFRLARSWKLVDDDWQPKDAASFADVTQDVAHCREIAWLAETGISEGWQMADGTRQFRPYASIARADMAAFIACLAKIAKVGGLTVLSDTPAFVDVSDQVAHADDIEWLAGTGISKGWQMADGTVEFCPYANVARADMAAFLHRLDNLR